MLLEVFFALSVFGTSTIESVWKYFCRTTSEYNMFVVGCFVSQLIGYFLGCLPYFLMDIFRSKQTHLYKIQGMKYPTSFDVSRTTKELLTSFATVVLPLLAFGGYVLPLLGISRDGPLPSVSSIILQIAFFFIVEDYFNYWIHRWLHQPWWYKHVHSVHHRYDAPFALVAAYAHPFEVVAQAIPTFLGPLAVAPHLYTLMLWQVFRNFEAIDIHSGYELPYSLKNLIPSYAGAKHHDYHHYMHSGNFASVFTWCDQLYGTNLGYEEFNARQIEKKRSSSLVSTAPSSVCFLNEEQISSMDETLRKRGVSNSLS